MQRTVTKHHIVPRSRFMRGTPREAMDKDNVVELPDCVHQAIHLIFGNCTKEESLALLDILLTPNKSWSYGDIVELRAQVRRIPCSSV